MEKYTFFNDVDDDRIYFAEDFAKHFEDFFTNGIFNNSCKVLADNNDMSVNVNVGSANINGYKYVNDSIKTLNIDNADGILNRIDNIVIRWDLTNRTIITQVIKGVFAEKPVAPPLERTSTIYDLRIAKINIPAGATEITQDLVTDTRFITSDCGNVVSAVETPDTEQLFIQIQAIFDKKISNMTGDFNSWFNSVKEVLTNTPVGNLEYALNNLKSDTDNLLKILGFDIDTYSNTATYKVNDLVVYENVPYYCTTAITKPEEFNEENWEVFSIFTFKEVEAEATEVAEN